MLSYSLDINTNKNNQELIHGYITEITKAA